MWLTVCAPPLHERIHIIFQNESYTHTRTVSFRFWFGGLSDICCASLTKLQIGSFVCLEAMLFVASQVETVEQSHTLQLEFGEELPNRFASEISRVIQSNWKRRSIEISEFEFGEWCFNEIEEFLVKPFRWTRTWLDEFYEDSDKSGEHYIMLTEQWLKEFRAMREMVKKDGSETIN